MSFLFQCAGQCQQGLACACHALQGDELDAEVGDCVQREDLLGIFRPNPVRGLFFELLDSLRDGVIKHQHGCTGVFQDKVVIGNGVLDADVIGGTIAVGIDMIDDFLTQSVIVVLPVYSDSRSICCCCQGDQRPHWLIMLPCRQRGLLYWNFSPVWVIAIRLFRQVLTEKAPPSFIRLAPFLRGSQILIQRIAQIKKLRFTG